MSEQSGYVRMVEMPPVAPDGRCSVCHRIPSRETGRCGCIVLAAAPSTPEPGIEHDCEWRRQVDDADETSAKLSQRLLRCQDELRAARLASKDQKEQT